jgi:hypothetical protein
MDQPCEEINYVELVIITYTLCFLIVGPLSIIMKWLGCSMWSYMMVAALILIAHCYEPDHFNTLLQIVCICVSAATDVVTLMLKILFPYL